ncbi:MAG TPA: IS66 family transposase zinc-finger binding domain-containing protein [Polyangiaceae bacterium]|nr:IS66 family transposase zinc-finger binding domain-containing protein [Polyangiaceae bacterium]
MLESSNADALNRIHELECALRERDEQLLQKDAQIQFREQRIRLLEEALRYLKADKYGASREKLGEAPGQRGLFNEVETIEELMQAVGVEVPLSATPLRESKPSNGKPGRKALASHLPRIPVRHDLPESEQVCACGTKLVEFDAEVSEQLDYEPAKIRVIRHIRPKYSCPCCKQGVKVAPLPAHLLPAVPASASRRSPVLGS